MNKADEIEEITPGTYKVTLSSSGLPFGTSGKAQVTVFKNGKLFMGSWLWDLSSIDYFNIVAQNGDEILIKISANWCSCEHTKLLICKKTIMENTLTIDGVKITLTDEQSKQLKEQLCKPKEPEKPEKITWESLGEVRGWYVTSTAIVIEANSFETMKTHPRNKSTWPTKKLAEASIALAQLMQLRVRILETIDPNTPLRSPSFMVGHDGFGRISIGKVSGARGPLLFATRRQAEKLLNDCADLLEIAKPLL